LARSGGDESLLMIAEAGYRTALAAVASRIASALGQDYIPNVVGNQ